MNAHAGFCAVVIFSLAFLAGCGESAAPEAASEASVDTAAAVVAGAATAEPAASTEPTTSASAKPSGAYTPTASQDKRLRYRFEPDKAYHYNVTSELDLDERLIVTTARCSYSTVTPKTQFAQPQEPLTATGTAFVIHADGFLLTCAHVIEDGEKIEVALGSKKYAAQALAFDDALDIALLKIEAKGLPTLPLANSDKVQVGQEVRAIGYPLSDVLGNSLKATRGTVSGIDTIDDGQRFQIDASVNGGNSGGPLVTEGGQVVGVVNAKLTGSAISNVGFAVPVNLAQRMLASHKVKSPPAAAATKLEGTVLFQRVQPSVALVTVTLDRAAVAGTQTLQASGSTTHSERTKSPGQRPPQPNTKFFGGVSKPIQVEVDNRGQVLDLTGDDPPTMIMVGPVPLVIFEPLPADSRTKWSTHREYTMELQASEEKNEPERPFGPGRFGSDPFGDRFGPSSFGDRFGPRGPFGPRFGPGGARPQQSKPKQVKKLPVVEDTSYTLASRSGDLVMITKKYEMKAQEAGGKMGIELNGEGTLTFDAKAGQPKKMDYKGTMNISQGQVSVKFPVTLKYEQTDGQPAPPPAKVASQPQRSESPAARPRPFPSRLAPAAPDKEFVPVASKGGKLSVRASGVGGQSTPDLAFDGDSKSAWGAGGWPIQWIEADLIQPTKLARIKLLVGQVPACETEHEVWISDSPLGHERAGGKLVHTFRGATKTDDLLEFAFPLGATARYVQIRSTKSRSWIAWPEIDIQSSK